MNKIDMLKNVVRNVGDKKFISCYVENVHSVTCPLRYLLHKNVLYILGKVVVYVAKLFDIVTLTWKLD